jgi:eukaryotic-like serine/threonine-protein kinase
VKPVASSSSADTITGVGASQGLPPGSVLAGRYRIESLLGIGGMGMVYRATDLSLGLEVALKLLRPELSSRSEAFERFRQELLLARQVSSPHVLRIHDMGRDGPHWFISMDFVDGEPLDRLLDREGALPLERALQIAAQVAAGLAAAHAQQVVHRDLKPSNVLIDGRGNAIIADFGVARSLGSTGLTHTGAIVGTPDYLSPEQARGGSIDARSDLYTLGLLLYEMLSGQLPFASSTASEALSQRLSGHLPPIERKRRDLPAWVARLVARLLKATPAHRFQSADEVVAAIAARRVARDWRPWLRRGAIGGAALALLGVLLMWTPPLRPPLLAPPDRLLVLPIEFDGDGLSRTALAALGEHLRHGVEAAAGPAVVDGERTAQALIRLGAGDGGAVDTGELFNELPATALLKVRLLQEGRGYRAASQWQQGSGAPATLDSGTPRGNPVEAVDILLLRLREQLGAPAIAAGAGLLPVSLEALGLYGEGVLLRRQGQLEAALWQFDAATVLEPGYAAAWLALAETARLAGDPARAQQAIARGRELPSPALAGTFALLGELQGSDLDAAERRLRDRLAQAPDDFWNQLRLAEVLGDRGEYPAADELLGELMARDPGEARGWLQRGKFAILRGLVQPAVDDYLVRAVLLFKRYRNRFGEAEAVNALGVGYGRLGQIADAEEQFRRSMELREAIGHRRGIANSLRNLAQLATVRGQTSEAAAMLDRARSLYDGLGDRAGLAAVDNELGVLAEERGDYAQALESFRLALRGREALGDRHGGAESLNNIGFAHYQLGDYDSARVFWKQANDIFLQLDDLNGATRTGQNLGLLEIVRGRWAEARRLLDESLVTAERQHMAEEAAVSRRNLAELALLQGEHTAALEQLERALPLFVERQDLRGLVDIGLLRARLLLGVGAADRAERELAVLAERLPQASTEQRAMAALLRAELARHAGDSAAARKALEEARGHAGAAGGRALLLQIELFGGRGDDALGAEIQALGHRRLWLQWAEQALLTRLAGGGDAVALYRETQHLLRDSGRYAGAWRLHRLGARAHAAAGNATAAAEAAARADEAYERLRKATPAALQPSLDRLAQQAFPHD